MPLQKKSLLLYFAVSTRGNNSQWTKKLHNPDWKNARPKN